MVTPRHFEPIRWAEEVCRIIMLAPDEPQILSKTMEDNHPGEFTSGPGPAGPQLEDSVEASGTVLKKAWQTRVFDHNEEDRKRGSKDDDLGL